MISFEKTQVDSPHAESVKIQTKIPIFIDISHHSTLTSWSTLCVFSLPLDPEYGAWIVESFHTDQWMFLVQSIKVIPYSFVCARSWLLRVNPSLGSWRFICIKLKWNLGILGTREIASKTKKKLFLTSREVEEEEEEEEHASTHSCTHGRTWGIPTHTHDPVPSTHQFQGTTRNKGERMDTT